MKAEPRELLEGLRVAITGRLASMTRPQAVRRLEAARATYVDELDEETDLLVVGQGGPPLGDGGRLTAKLVRVRDIKALGGDLRVISEAEYLALLGEGPEGVDRELRRLYTGQQLCRILGISAGSLRSWIRAGLIQPARTVHRLALFEFSEVAGARAILALKKRGVAMSEVRRSLEQLAAWLPSATEALSSLPALDTGRLGLRRPTP